MSAFTFAAGRMPARVAGAPTSRTAHPLGLKQVGPRRAARPGVAQAGKRPEYIPGRIDDPNYVRIFDTTLRDGEQSPGATLTSKEKLDIARQLAKLGVDIIEAGFPVASPDDFEAVRAIAMEVGNDVQPDGYVPVICGLSRTKLQDLERAWDAVRHAKRPRVHTFIATSEIHMKYKLRMSEDQVVDSAVAAVKHLKSLGCNDIEFSPEDAGRSEPKFLYRILGEVIKAGATTINIPDTTGALQWQRHAAVHVICVSFGSAGDRKCMHHYCSMPDFVKLARRASKPQHGYAYHMIVAARAVVASSAARVAVATARHRDAVTVKIVQRRQYHAFAVTFITSIAYLH